jgi:hypothetical protein
LSGAAAHLLAINPPYGDLAPVSVCCGRSAKNTESATIALAVIMRIACSRIPPRCASSRLGASLAAAPLDVCPRIPPRVCQHLSPGRARDFCDKSRDYLGMPTNTVGVRQVSRLISRIRHRQFGVLGTTSVIARQAHEEVREDRRPIIFFSGRDIADILINNGFNTPELVISLLNTEFPLTQTA